MLRLTGVCFATLLLTVSGADQNYILPDGFLMGVASSAYQIEGGSYKDGKGPSIWDTQTSDRSNLIVDHSRGDVACDSYNRYKEDVQMVKELGVDFYRFSISWPRILPDGHAYKVNQAGIDYYNNLINELIANIQPMVTMYAWDLPQSLQDLGGWPNVVLVNYFEDFARILYTNFGDRVKYWFTFNEPLTFTNGYENSTGPAPAIGASGYGMYLASYTLLKAHARAYHLYNDEFREKQQGKVGIIIGTEWCEHPQNTAENIDACERKNQFEIGLYANPIFSKEGDWPAIVKERVDVNSKAEGLGHSRLPTFTQEEIEYIRGTSDFFGFSHYTSRYAVPYDGSNDPPSVVKDKGISLKSDPNWPKSASSWLNVVPWGIRKELGRIAKLYNNPPILITGNGYSDRGDVNDTCRINYHVSYLTEMLKAIHEDKCNVLGYTAWSLMDNFEWNQGYTEKFGLYRVEFRHPHQARSTKESTKVYTEIVKTRQIPERFRTTES